MMTSKLFIVPMDLTRSICSIHFEVLDRFARLDKVRWELDDQRQEGLVLEGNRVVAKLVHVKDAG